MMLNGTGEEIDAYDYPATTDQLIDELGDRTLELANGSETVADVLGRLETETFERPEDARFAVYSAVGEAAIGRKGYSDRDPTTISSPHPPEPLSF